MLTWFCAIKNKLFPDLNALMKSCYFSNAVGIAIRIGQCAAVVHRQLIGVDFFEDRLFPLRRVVSAQYLYLLCCRFVQKRFDHGEGDVEDLGSCENSSRKRRRSSNSTRFFRRKDRLTYRWRWTLDAETRGNSPRKTESLESPNPWLVQDQTTTKKFFGKITDNNLKCVNHFILF